MIRDFKITDLDSFIPNQFSDPKEFYYVLDSNEYFKYTVHDHEENIKAIICFKEKEPRDWCGFFLISDNFRFKDAAEIKTFMNKQVEKFKPKRVWTASRDNEIINNWHIYLGMKIENAIMLEGQALNIWSIIYGN